MAPPKPFKDTFSINLESFISSMGLKATFNAAPSSIATFFSKVVLKIYTFSAE